MRELGLGIMADPRWRLQHVLLSSWMVRILVCGSWTRCCGAMPKLEGPPRGINSSIPIQRRRWKCRLNRNPSLCPSGRNSYPSTGLRYCALWMVSPSRRCVWMYQGFQSLQLRRSLLPNGTQLRNRDWRF
jgi:hypothetical protein